MRRVGTVLGAMEFGRGPCVGPVPAAMVEAFLAADETFRQVDTAYMYSGGESEAIMGQMDRLKEEGVFIATKVNSWDGKNFKEASLREQVATSLGRLGVASVDLLYLHSPDPGTDIAETMRAMDTLHREGKYRRLGLSNYSSWEVARTLEICRREGWVQPTVYQGMYSAITRQVEEELIPCLRHYGLSFYAYSPLGGGILTGKYQYQQDQEKTIATGRFNGVGWDKIYRDRYWKKEHFDAIESLKVLLSEQYPGEEVSVPEAAYRWLYHHSRLSGEHGDCVVVGASRLDQLATNLAYTQRPPLEKPVVQFFNDWWKSTKHMCPKYFR